MQRSKEGRGRTGWTRERKVRQNRLHPHPVHEEEAEPQVRTCQRVRSVLGMMNDKRTV